LNLCPLLSSFAATFTLLAEDQFYKSATICNGPTATLFIKLLAKDRTKDVQTVRMICAEEWGVKKIKSFTGKFVQCGALGRNTVFYLCIPSKKWMLSPLYFKAIAGLPSALKDISELIFQGEDVGDRCPDSFTLLSREWHAPKHENIDEKFLFHLENRPTWRTIQSLSLDLVEEITMPEVLSAMQRHPSLFKDVHHLLESLCDLLCLSDAPSYFQNLAHPRIQRGGLEGAALQLKLS
jgi:hypothetical protein